MKVIETTIYTCTHCNKKYFSKQGARKHEKKCYYNPINKCCGTCAYYVKEFGCYCALRNQQLQPKKMPNHGLCEEYSKEVKEEHRHIYNKFYYIENKERKRK